MQPVFFISLFSLIFLMFSSMTTGITKNIMQANIERVANTKAMFKEVEAVINNVAFQDSKLVDFSDDKYLDLTGDYLPAKSSYTKSQISKDSWSRKIYLLKATDRVRIWGASGGQYADAPISHFMLVSAGPNQYYDLFNYWNFKIDSSTKQLIEAGGNVSADQIKTVDISDEDIVGDDVILRFNNYDTMYKIWQESEKLDTMVRDVSLEYYKNTVDAFSPLIQLAQRDKDLETVNNLSTDIFSDGDITDDGFNAFTGLQLGTSENFKNEWNNVGTNNSNVDSLLHSMLDGGKFIGVVPARTFTGYRVAKKYAGEFNVDNDVEDDFKDTYRNMKFLYPSYDLLDYDNNGHLLSSGMGLKNLGIPSLDVLDPFTKQGESGGALSYEYDKDNSPNILTLIRKTTSSNKDKWKINKKYKINGLGE